MKLSVAITSFYGTSEVLSARLQLTEPEQRFLRIKMLLKYPDLHHPV